MSTNLVAFYESELVRYFDHALKHYGESYCRDTLKVWAETGRDKRNLYASAYQRAVATCLPKLPMQ